MADSDEIVLVDLPSRPPQAAWSLNPWKTRFALNYKGLPYRTQWTEYPDIKPTLESHVPANEEGFTYTSPTIRLPDGTYVMDSRQIANKLESLHPSPTLHLDSPVLAKLESIMPQLMPTLSGIYIPLVPVRLLNEASHPHWYKTREAKFGMPLSKLAETKGGDVAWSAAKPYLEQVTAMLKEDTSGPYFMGQEVSYADFVWAGFLIFFQRIGDDVFQKMLETAGDRDVHLALLVGVKKWSARDDR